MKNVTISMDEETLGWVRIEAARAGQSMSAWLAEKLRRLKGGQADLETEMAAFLATPEAPMSDGGRTFVREEIYDRPMFRRFR